MSEASANSRYFSRTADRLVLQERAERQRQSYRCSGQGRASYRVFTAGGLNVRSPRLHLELAGYLQIEAASQSEQVHRHRFDFEHACFGAHSAKVKTVGSSKVRREVGEERFGSYRAGSNHLADKHLVWTGIVITSWPRNPLAVHSECLVV